MDSITGFGKPVFLLASVSNRADFDNIIQHGLQPTIQTRPIDDIKGEVDIGRINLLMANKLKL
ncbi:hypothetical protein BG74_08980 [Sodalis-like endosymbiont of Proechinophthirus fluctus]|nr:hypothetical protein BG74_08980 [Sodalis-like endosymbiont of Proechinophthirus fluctus]